MSFYEDHVFPVLLDAATRPLQRDRRELVARARGRVLELGSGTGANLPFYGPAATEVVGLEPSAAMIEDARARAAVLPQAHRFSFVQGGAEALAWPDASFDTVIACLVFCTIPDAAGAAREAFRVLKPGGEMLVLEHVLHPRENVRRWQRRLDPVWTKLACGCHLTRDTGALLRGAGFDFQRMEAFEHPKVPALAGAMIRGIATRPA